MRALLIAAILAAAPGVLAAQGSLFGIRGFGHPGRAMSVRSLGTGGAFAPVDELSSTNPGAVGGAALFAASFSALQDFRAVSSLAGDEDVRAARFPLIAVAGPVGRSKFAVGLSFSTYLDRDFALAQTDTLILRGVPVEVFDTTFSRGGFSDIRAALGYKLGRRGAIGLGLHLITGATRNELRRTFTDTLYASGGQRAEISGQAFGVSVGVVQQFSSTFVLAASARTDGTLRINRDSTRVSQSRLPVTVQGGLKWRPSPRLDVGAQGTFRTWSRSDADLVAQGAPGAADTYDVGIGLEYATDKRDFFHLPIRAGFRYATLPFYLVRGEQATEIGGSLGTGQRLAQGRASLDLALEYLRRSDGTGRRENAVLVSVGVTVRP